MSMQSCAIMGHLAASSTPTELPIDERRIVNATAHIAAARDKMRWHNPPIHPAAAKFPMMSDTELDELARDIRQNGLQQPIILFCDNTEAANGATDGFTIYLLDGRNRLEALRRAGYPDPLKAPRGDFTADRVRTMYALKRVSTIGAGTMSDGWAPDVNPVTYVLSANVHRRHLTEAQKRDAIAAYAEAEPTASNRKIARDLGVDHKTVADVRTKSPQNSDVGDSTRNGEFPQNSDDKPSYQKSSSSPIERAKWALLNNTDPVITNWALGNTVNVSDYTIRKARKELIASGELQAKAHEPEPEPPPPSEPERPKPGPLRKRDRNADRLAIAIGELATLTTQQQKVIKTIEHQAETAGLTEQQRAILTREANHMHQLSMTLRGINPQKEGTT